MNSLKLQAALIGNSHVGAHSGYIPLNMPVRRDVLICVSGVRSVGERCEGTGSREFFVERNVLKTCAKYDRPTHMSIVS